MKILIKTTHTMQSQQAGLTLIEILVAMVISLILMAGVLQIFQANKQSFRVQESLSLIQENGRTAMRILAEDLRMADFWGCRSQDIDITDNLDTSGAGYVNLLTNGGLTGTDNAGLNASDTITISGARSTGLTMSAAMGTEGSNISVTSGGNLQPGDIALITDCVKGDIFQVTNATSPGASDPIEHSTGGGITPDNSTADLSRIYDTDAMVFPARQTTYSIVADPDSGEPSLFRTEGGVPLELVEGIEDMQIQYGELLNAVSGAMRYVTASDGTLDMTQVRSVRITLTARSIATGVAIGGDGRLRRTFDNTISIRNRNP
ncbi:MAG: prepilin-type N-terminal cleavage/methylation domain-containing protein [Gammaproteobacteria bacterium]|nr:prepilin-type N-terminal cleavage/methylation domain-containing protein [Gammaproteobacteria bacterium]